MWSVMMTLSRKVFWIITRYKMKFFIKYFFSKLDQIRSFLRIWSHLPKKSLMGNFCAVNNEIVSSNQERLLCILLFKLNFDSHNTSHCKKAGQKISALARINHYLTPDQKTLLLISAVKSQFSYCPWSGCLLLDI